MIQDMIISTVQIVFAVALIPTVFGKSLPHFWTSAITATGLCVLAGCFISLDLWFSAITASASALLWWIITVRKAIQNAQ